MDDVLNLFWEKAASKGVDLAGYIAPDVPETILGDPVRLNQILSNLVNNALKFTETGHVKVEVRAVAGDGVDEKTGLKFSVFDTGIGIAQDKLATVFESFSQADQTTTRRFGGTGLGLAICKRLIETMGGEISVASIEGQGSEFFFTIMPPPLEAGPRGSDHRRLAGSLTKGLVAVNGAATSRVLADYLKDNQISANIVGAQTLGSAVLGGYDLVLAEPEIIGSLKPMSQPGQPAEKPYMVSVSQLGDSRSDELIEQGRVHERLMRPVSHAAFHALIGRLDAGTPLGRSVLDCRESTKLPRYPDANVLVADDSPVNREVVTEALKQLNVRADVVENGAAAVKAAAEKLYHLIFMDCSMPEMDGFEATRRIRSAETETGNPAVPIIALTAHVAGSKGDEWRQAGMNDYMTKPFRIDDLVTGLESFLPEEVRQSAANDDEPNEAPRETAAPAAAPVQDPPSPAPAGDLAIIDESVLEAVANCQEGDGSELLLRVLRLFEDHAPPALLTLAELAQAGSTPDKIGDAAHALKSMCRNIGALRLGAACDRLESEASGGHIDGLTAQLARLQSELIAALEDIHRIKKDVRNATVAKSA